MATVTTLLGAQAEHRGQDSSSDNRTNTWNEKRRRRSDEAANHGSGCHTLARLGSAFVHGGPRVGNRVLTCEKANSIFRKSRAFELVNRGLQSFEYRRIHTNPRLAPHRLEFKLSRRSRNRRLGIFCEQPYERS